LGNLTRIRPQDQLAFLTDRTKEAHRRIVSSLKSSVSRTAHKIQNKDGHPFTRLERINDAALQEYVAQPYQGVVTLFMPKTNYAGNRDKYHGWDSGLTSGIDAQPLDVYPAGMLVRPYVTELADKLRVCLDDAYAPHADAKA